MENKKYKILLVDDEQDILEFLSYSLKKEGYKVICAENGHEAIAIAKKEKPDLIVLDVMMPEMDGIETCAQIRGDINLKDCIIVFLSARSEDYSQISGFDAGADDYVTKPIKPKVFVKRINALLRRVNKEVMNDKMTLNIGELLIDKEKYTVVYKSKKYTLPKKEFELLALLASKPNKVFTRQEIFSKIWGDDVIVGDRTIDVHIRKIREKMDFDKIKTVKGVGYKFED